VTLAVDALAADRRLEGVGPLFRSSKCSATADRPLPRGGNEAKLPDPTRTQARLVAHFNATPELRPSVSRKTSSPGRVVRRWRRRSAQSRESRSIISFGI
jgi:hypothetical protein